MIAKKTIVIGIAFAVFYLVQLGGIFPLDGPGLVCYSTPNIR